MISAKNGSVSYGRSADARTSVLGLGLRLLLMMMALTLPGAHRSFAQQTARAKAIGQKLICMCGCKQGLVACNHVGCTTSRAMLKEVDERVARGDSDDLILQAFVQEYGPTVLAEPPMKGFNWVAWVIPVLAPLIAFYIVWEVVRRWRRSAAVATAGGPSVPAELLDRARHESEQESDE